MIGEFKWSDEKKYLGVILEHNHIPPDKHATYSEQNFEIDFNLLLNIFGPSGFAMSSRFDADRVWLQENLIKNEMFEAFIWYPANVNTSTDEFEKVHIERGEAKYDIHITSHGEEDLEVICFYKISPNDFTTNGLSIINEAKMKDTYSIDLSDYRDFNDEISAKLVHVDRTVTERHIHYLDKLIPLQQLSYYEERLGLNRLHNMVKILCHADKIELWNAFVVVVEANKLTPIQILHRDAYYDSVSLFFYLDEPCDPGTMFWPLTHRLTGALVEGLCTSQAPKLKVGQILAMHGRMLHQGCPSSSIHSKQRMLYVFQYRPCMKRAERARVVSEIKHALEMGSDVGTVFKVG